MTSSLPTAVEKITAKEDNLNPSTGRLSRPAPLLPR
jgi:hypothetical protein